MEGNLRTAYKEVGEVWWDQQEVKQPKTAKEFLPLSLKKHGKPVGDGGLAEAKASCKTQSPLRLPAGQTQAEVKGKSPVIGVWKSAS
jgi:hypothetical protein